MWFRRKQKTDPDNALSETLRSLQELLEEERPDQSNGLAATNQQTQSQTPEPSHPSTGVPHSAPKPQPDTERPDKGPNADLDRPAASDINPDSASIADLQTFLEPTLDAVDIELDVIQVSGLNESLPEAEEHTRHTTADDIPTLKNAIENPSVDSSPVAPIATDREVAETHTSSDVTNNSDQKITTNTLDRIPVLRTVIFEPESEPKPTPRAPVKSTFVLSAQTETWINQVVDNYKLRLHLAEAEAMSSIHERELRETLADIVLDRTTNLDTE